MLSGTIYLLLIFQAWLPVGDTDKVTFDHLGENVIFLWRRRRILPENNSVSLKSPRPPHPCKLREQFNITIYSRSGQITPKIGKCILNAYLVTLIDFEGSKMKRALFLNLTFNLISYLFFIYNFLFYNMHYCVQNLSLSFFVDLIFSF